MVWPVAFTFVHYLSAMRRKLEDDGKTATTTLPLATHFPNILSKQTKAPENIVTSQIQLVGRQMQILP